MGDDPSLVAFGQELCTESSQGLIGTQAGNNIALEWTIREAGDKVGRGTAPHTVDLMTLAASSLCPQYTQQIHTEASDDD